MEHWFGFGPSIIILALSLSLSLSLSIYIYIYHELAWGSSIRVYPLFTGELGVEKACEALESREICFYVQT